MANATAAKLSCSQFASCYSPQLILHGQNSCCDTARQIHEGVSSHSVCPCQLERVLNRVPSVPVSVLPRPNFSDGSFSIGTDVSAFYSPLARPCDVKEVAQVWRDSWYLAQAAAARHSFEISGFDPHSRTPTCARFAERFSPIDLAAAGARRKNATRETTSTLKAWLYEHRKNPYPTKGEKIMLAIITKMTLTQVSTWFANARRRLKKENKMTWSPRNRCGDKKENGEGSESDGDSDDDEELEKKLDELDTREVKNNDEEKENDHKIDERQREKITGIAERNDANYIASKRWSAHDLRTLCISAAAPTTEDSPVKSLRKWVDGCFHQKHALTKESPPIAQPDTPPSTPPFRVTAETPVITCASRLTPSPPAVKLESHSKEENKRTRTEEVFQTRPVERRSPEVADHREIDAALALTTLSSR